MVTASSRRRRTSSPSCRCASGFSVSLETEIASSSSPATSPLPLSWVLPPCAATALILLTRLLLGTPLALYCNCSLTYNYQVSDFKHGQASRVSIALQFPSAYHRGFPGTHLIYTPPHVVTSCSRKYFNSVRPVFPSPLHEAIALAALESVHTRTRALSSKSVIIDYIPRPSAASAMQALYSASAVLSAREACVLDQ